MKNFLNEFLDINEKLESYSIILLKNLNNYFNELLENIDFYNEENFSNSFDNTLKEFEKLKCYLNKYDWIKIFNEEEYNNALLRLEEIIKFFNYKEEILIYKNNYELEFISNIFLNKSTGSFYFTPISNFSFKKFINNIENKKEIMITIEGPTYKDLFKALLNSTKNGYIIISNEYGEVISIISSKMNINLNNYYNYCIKPFINKNIEYKIINNIFFKLNKSNLFENDFKPYRNFLKELVNDDSVYSNICLTKTCLISRFIIFKSNDNIFLLSSAFNEYLMLIDDYYSLNDINFNFDQKRIGQHLFIKMENDNNEY